MRSAIRFPLFFGFIFVLSTGAWAYRDHGSWKRSLHDKAILLERNAEQRHNIVGTYPSSVRIEPLEGSTGAADGGWKKLVETGELPEGWTFDHGTTGVSNVAHTSSWTGCQLTGKAFEVAFLRDSLGEDHPDFQMAYKRADEIIAGLRILTLVSGQPGYLARGVALGHGIGYEERGGSGTRDLWKQGVGELSHLRYRGGPSHHNYDQVFRGLGTYYFVAADEAQKDAIREIVRDMSNWAHLSNDMRVMHDDGKRESTVLIGGWRGMEGTDEPSGGSLMATTGLKIAAEITGNEEIAALYEKWVDRLGYRDPERTKESVMGEARTNYDDTDHLLGDLFVLLRIEKDPDLRAFYTKCVKDSWEVHKTEKMSWFNYVYGAVLGEEYADLEGSLWNLQTFPTCRLFQPQMNSIRDDIEIITRNGRKEAKDPLPVYERASDNEYEWKGSPFELDRWLSRIVSIVEVSPHDPYVQFAADTSGSAYISLTRGETWDPMSGLPRVNDFLFSDEYPWIAFAATSGGVYRTLSGGHSWGQVHSTPVERLRWDEVNGGVLYAWGPSGIFKSHDLGERKVGSVWDELTQSGVTSDAVFAVGPGSPAALYRMASDGIYTKTEGDTTWTSPGPALRTRGFGGVDPIGGKPLWIRADATVPDRLFRAVSLEMRGNARPFLSVSDDGGKTWAPVLKELTPLANWASGKGDTIHVTRDELRGYMGLLGQFPIHDLRVDRDDPNRWYGLTESGIAITDDAGENWKMSAKGLDIPRTEALWTPRESSDVYVGTPAGLYLSRDRGETWADTSLILNGHGTSRSEIGGIGYLTAYWMGRYLNFIDEETARADWWIE